MDVEIIPFKESNDFGNYNNHCNFYNDKLLLTKELYKHIDDFSLSSYFFFAKGMQMEHGIYKNINLTYAVEFYKQGGILGNSACYYQLYSLYSHDNENLVIIGDRQQQSLFYLLKSFSYYDETNILYQHSNYLARLFEIGKSINVANLEEYLEKHKNQLSISGTELEFLLINLDYISSPDKSDDILTYSTRLIEFYKKSLHEECLYKIICNLLRIGQFAYVNEILMSQGDLLQVISNSKIFAVIHKFIMESYKKLKDNKAFQQIYKIYSDNKNCIAKKLKIAGYYHFYAEIKQMEINFKFNFDQESEDLNNLNNQVINKIIKNYYRSLQFGQLDSILPLFQLTIFSNKHRIYEMYSGPGSGSGKEPNGYNQIEVLRSILDLLAVFNSSLKMSDDMLFILSMYYKKGILVKKNLQKCFEILNQIDKSNQEYIIIINYYQFICCHKLNLEDNEKIFRDTCINLYQLNQKSSSKLYIQNRYLIAKLFKSLNNTGFDSTLSIIKSQVKDFIDNFTSEHILSFCDKIYYNKIKNLCNNSKVTTLFPLPSTTIQNNTSSIQSTSTNTLCPLCLTNEKTIISVPCGHKFICNECYSKVNLKETIYNCAICNIKIESGIKKIFN
jgi:hypothetical protein